MRSSLLFYSFLDLLQPLQSAQQPEQPEQPGFPVFFRCSSQRTVAASQTATSASTAISAQPISENQTGELVDQNCR